MFLSFVVAEDSEQPDVDHAKHEQRHANVFNVRYIVIRGEVERRDGVVDNEVRPISHLVSHVMERDDHAEHR